MVTYSRLVIIKHHNGLTAQRFAILARMERKNAAQWLKRNVKRGLLTLQNNLYTVSSGVRLC